jgi:hypothetical protein
MPHGQRLLALTTCYLFTHSPNATFPPCL